MWFFSLCVLFALSLFRWFVLWFAVINILVLWNMPFYCFWQIFVLQQTCLLCLARLWTCFVGFSYSRSGPNMQPQSGVITPCEQKSVTRVPERCLRLRRLPEWLVRVQRLQSFRCDKLSKLSDVQTHLCFRQFLCFPHHFICFKWKCHIKLIPAFWLV